MCFRREESDFPPSKTTTLFNEGDGDGDRGGVRQRGGEGEGDAEGDESGARQRGRGQQGNGDSDKGGGRVMAMATRVVG